MMSSLSATVTTIYRRCEYCTRHVFTSRLSRRACFDCLDDPASGATWPLDDDETIEGGKA